MPWVTERTNQLDASFRLSLETPTKLKEMHWPRHLLIVTLALFWCTLIFAAPCLTAGTHRGLGWMIFLLFSELCHQNPLRSFTLGGISFPVCSRCFGIYFGGLVGMLVFPWVRHCRAPLFKNLCLITLLLLVFDVGMDFSRLIQNTFLSRTLTGALFGAANGML